MFKSVLLKSVRNRVIYSFFWKKQVVEEEGVKRQENQKENSELPNDEWKGKEEFLKDLKQKREEYETMKIKQQKEANTLTQRQSRDHEVRFGKVDYAKILMDNINIQSTNRFQHPDELFHFIGTLKVKLTEESLMVCVNSLMEMSDKLNEDDLIRFEYMEFQAILTRHLRIISNTQNLINISKLLDILCVPSEHEIWRELEIVLLRKLNKLSLNELLEIMNHLSNQREGSDQFWDHCENFIKNSIENLQEKETPTYKALLSYWRVQRGTTPFLNYLLNIVLKNKQINDINTIIQSNLVISSLAKKSSSGIHINNSQFKEYFQNIEEQLIAQIKELKFDQICLIAQGFGFDFGSEKLFQELERNVQKHQDLNINEFKLVIKSFMLNYRGSKLFIRELMKTILALKHEFTIAELGQIVKAVYITENDDDLFYKEIERKIIQRLKEVRELEVQEIYEIANSYLITRVGSRELYKLLEIIINFRFDDIRADGVLLGKLHDLYQKSALCDPALIQRMATFL